MSFVSCEGIDHCWALPSVLVKHSYSHLFVAISASLCVNLRVRLMSIHENSTQPWGLSIPGYPFLVVDTNAVTDADTKADTDTAAGAADADTDTDTDTGDYADADAYAGADADAHTHAHTP